VGVQTNFVPQQGQIGLTLCEQAAELACSRVIHFSVLLVSCPSASQEDSFKQSAILPTCVICDFKFCFLSCLHIDFFAVFMITLFSAGVMLSIWIAHKQFRLSSGAF